MNGTLKITPEGKLLWNQSAGDPALTISATIQQRIANGFARGDSAGLLHLATVELQSHLTPELAYFRDFGREYLLRLCHTPGSENQAGPQAVAPPALEDLAFRCMQAPPMQGLEYLNAQLLLRLWTDLDELVRREVAGFPGGTAAYLKDKNPIWRMVGRVTFHLAENKRDPSNPFAFLATYANRLSAQATLRHLPLSEALKEYAGAGNRQQLIALLTPIERAAEKSQLVRELVNSGDIYHPLAWQPESAYRFLQDVPVFEESGLVVRVPNWWRAGKSSRAVVNVTIGKQAKTRLDADALLDFSVNVSVDGHTVSDEELQSILAASNGLMLLKGQWVEIDKQKLTEALGIWKHVETQAGTGGVSFFEAMRMLSGVGVTSSTAVTAEESTRAWSEVVAGDWLAARLAELRNPEAAPTTDAPAGLLATLRPYQKVGVQWLHFMVQLGLGACLADDMGLGKTIQVLGLLLHLKEHKEPKEHGTEGNAMPPSLLIVPASLIANWRDELAKFAPTLKTCVVHPSEKLDDWSDDNQEAMAQTIGAMDLLITTYGMATRLAWLAGRPWNVVILDEAQAIKNSGTKQTRSVKQFKAAARVVLTGTPVENRLSDLWSIFDFLNPGLLGGAKAFGTYAKSVAESPGGYAPLRALVQPYILRRLKTDKRIISDLPDKTEVRAFCALSKQQIALYQMAVDEMASKIKEADGIARRGLVLSYLMRFKQICNHPSQLLGDGAYDPSHSGKFLRLAELCEEMAARQEKVLIFTQFREITAALEGFLESIFGRPGLILHGGTAVANRKQLVQQFQSDNGPPFFVLSLKAGGVGLNLTAASQVVHFDRWWNPAVENQATDRAFRIGQKKNVLVHKFICQGTLEDKIDTLMTEKTNLSNEILQGGADQMLTEMNNQELLNFVTLDIHRVSEL